MGHQGRWDIGAGDQGPGERQVRAGKAGIWVRGQSRALIVKWADDLICQDHAALPPAAPSLPTGLVREVAVVAGMEAMDGLHNMAFHSPRPGYGCP